MHVVINYTEPVHKGGLWTHGTPLQWLLACIFLTYVFELYNGIIIEM